MRSLLQVKATGFIFGLFLRHPKSITNDVVIRLLNDVAILLLNDIAIRLLNDIVIRSRSMLHIKRGLIFVMT